MEFPTAEPRQVAWITGAAGLIGNWLAKLAPECAPRLRVHPLTRAELDLTRTAEVEALFKRETPALVVHCAALSRSTDCEATPPLARRVNVDMTAHLAQLAAGIPFVFFSTDLVFDGQRGNYDESAEVNPLSVYAQTKAAAEQIVLANPRHTVIRTSLNAGPSPAGDRGFDEQLFRAWQEGQTPRLYTDEFRCPIAAEATARAVWELIRRNRPGLYHIAGAERLSRWDIGRLVAACHPELNPRLEPASLKEYSGAPRSPDTSLNCAKVQQLLASPLPHWSEWLRRRAGRSVPKPTADPHANSLPS